MCSEVHTTLSKTALGARRQPRMDTDCAKSETAVAPIQLHKGVSGLHVFIMTSDVGGNCIISGSKVRHMT